MPEKNHTHTHENLGLERVVSRDSSACGGSLLLDEALHTLAHGVPLVRERDRDAVPCLVLDHDGRGEARGERLGL